jgi:hypothetical protein
MAFEIKEQALEKVVEIARAITAAHEHFEFVI